MKATFRQSMTWLHTWTGLLLGWVLFAIFVTGTATYFKQEISQWMQPELQRSGTPFDAARTAVKKLEAVAERSPQWFVTLPDERSAATQIMWRNPGAGRGFPSETIDAATGEKVAARDTRGGEFFYRFHFQLQLPHPWGRYLAGVAAMFMLIALISGVVTHRQFFKDFFTFRPGRASLRSFLDFHNVTAVLALPFYFMITYSALVIFMAMYMPWGQQVLADPNAPAARRSPPAATERGAKADWVKPATIEPMILAAEQAWGASDRAIKRLDISGRGTAKSTVTLTRADGPKISLAAREQLVFDGVTGVLVDSTEKTTGIGRAVHDAFYGLHLARFAGPALRWAFFTMGLFGSALVATGLIMWTIKRRPKQLKAARLSFGHGLVERLNIATVAGLPIAIAVLLWANRLLPVGLAERGDWEVYAFFYAWGAAVLHPLIRPIMKAWREQLFVGAVLFILLPALDALTAGDYLRAAWAAKNWAYLGFDTAMFALGGLLWFAARRVSRRSALKSARPDESSAPALSSAQATIEA